MVKEFLNIAKAGDPVYITTVREAYENLRDSKRQILYCVLTLFEDNGKKLFKISLPIFDGMGAEEISFVKSYVWAEIYNILSSLGGKVMDIYLDSSNKALFELADELGSIFCIDCKRSDRAGYGRCINVIDRMLGVLCPTEPAFRFNIHDISEMPEIHAEIRKQLKDPGIFTRVTENLDGKIICGMDIGGTDIKSVLAKDGKIDCYKEYDWFPAGFRESSQLIEPICLLVRLIRAKVSLDEYEDVSGEKAVLVNNIRKALDKNADEDSMLAAVEKAEAFLNGKFTEIDAIGLCFPDVVVKNKIVGGEVYKTRGIRNNPEIN